MATPQLKRSPPSSITRREVVRLGALGLVGLGLRSRTLAGNEPTPDEFTFIAVNDLHFSDAECQPWFERVVAQMKGRAPKARFCLLGGDLADQGTTAQLSGVREAFARLRIPVHAVVGNHDYLTNDDRSAYERIFPNQINYRFDYHGWQLLGLDTSEGTNSQNTTISEKTFSWLEANLPKLEPSKPTIIVTHFPLGPLVFGRPRNANNLLERLADLNVQAIFSGHFHGFTERHFANAVLTTDRCCSRIRENHDGTKEKGWFLCTAANGQVSRTFIEFTG